MYLQNFAFVNCTREKITTRVKTAANLSRPFIFHSTELKQDNNSLYANHYVYILLA